MKTIQITKDLLNNKLKNKPYRFDMAINFYCCIKRDDKYYLVTYYYNPAWNLYYPFYDDINKYLLNRPWKARGGIEPSPLDFWAQLTGSSVRGQEATVEQASGHRLAGCCWEKGLRPVDTVQGQLTIK